MTPISGLDAITGKTVRLSGVVIQLAPLSFWGGVESSTGRIIDSSHPSYGLVLAGQIIAMSHARGSSSSSSVLAECLRLKTAPKAMLLKFPDPIIIVAVLIATELYGATMPVLVVPEEFL